MTDLATRDLVRRHRFDPADGEIKDRLLAALLRQHEDGTETGDGGSL